jgi:hypothetical protein
MNSRASFGINSQRLQPLRHGSVRVHHQHLTLRGTYQFTKATFDATDPRLQHTGLALRAQALFGWTPSPGTPFYAGYNDDLNYDTPPSLQAQIVPGLPPQLEDDLHQDVVPDQARLLNHD